MPNDFETDALCSTTARIPVQAVIDVDGSYGARDPQRRDRPDQRSRQSARSSRGHRSAQCKNRRSAAMPAKALRAQPAIAPA